jgi:glycolate oxidase iron-sulfur subunit
MKLFPQRLAGTGGDDAEGLRNFSAELIAPVTPAAGTKKYRVAMLTGCAQDLTFSDVNRDTVEVLAQNGCEVITPPEQSCCGSLHAHNGEWTLAQQLARRNIDQFPPEQFDAIITNAGGCGSHLKHYAKLLADDPIYRRRAELWDVKVKDIHEWLAQIRNPQSQNPQSVKKAARSRSPTMSPAILTHGQKVVIAAARAVESIPGLKLIELPEANWCCGSAGIYNLTQPEMAGQLLDRKIAHIKSTGATTVATANPGCLLQLINGAAQGRIETARGASHHTAGRSLSCRKFTTEVYRESLTSTGGARREISHHGSCAPSNRSSNNS